MQRIRKLSNDLKEALIPKSDKPQPRRRPSLRSGQPVRASDIKKIANCSLGELDPDAMESGSTREVRAAVERWRQDSYHRAMTLAREQDARTNSIVFPSSSSHPKTRTKAQEKPVPVPSFDGKANRHQDSSGDWDARGNVQGTSTYRNVLDPQTKAASASTTVPGKKLKRRCPYSPSKFLAISLSIPAAPSRATTGPPVISDRNSASQVDAGMSTSLSTQSQPSTPAWPPEGSATVKRQQRTPKSSIDSLYRSRSDVHIPALATPRDTGHSRTASEPHSRDVQSHPIDRGYPSLDDARDDSPDLTGAFGKVDSSTLSRSSHRAASQAKRDAKTSLQVRELSTSHSVQVEPASLGRAKSHKATVVHPSFASTPPSTQSREGTSTASRADKAHSRGRGSKKMEVEVSYMTFRQVAEKENKRTQKDLSRELARWDLVPDTVPDPTPSSAGTRPLAVRKRSAMPKDRDPRLARY